MDLGQFLTELKGRGVNRVAAFYAAGSWALLQVADLFFPILGFPDWAITAVLVAAAIGFPVAVAMAWVFEITPEGIVETDATALNVGHLLLSPARLLELGLLITLVCLVGWLYVERLTLKEETTNFQVDSSRPSVAVMPFKNMSNDPDAEYFGDGLAEEILNLLARVSELDVAARTSSFYFKDKEVDLREVSSKLGVNHILEGSVRRSGDRVRVTAQLIETSSGYHAWSETYDRAYSDSFRIQDEIALSVVRGMQVILSDSSREILYDRPTLDPQAYDFYLRGSEYLRRPLNNANMTSASALFTRATDLDPKYAAAYAGLCDAQLGLYRLESDTAQFNSARASCQAALALEDDTLPVYVALGNLYRMSGKYAEAQELFLKALTDNPGSVDALDGLGHTYKMQGSWKQAEEIFEKQIAQQPNYWRGYLSMGRFLFASGRFNEAIRYFQRVTDLMPDNAQALSDLGATYYLLGDFEKAAQIWARSLEINPTALAYSNAGSALFFLQRYLDAVDMYLKALAYAPEDFQTWGSLGDAYRYTDGKTRELAKPMYANALKLAQGHLKINASDALTLSLVAYYEATLGKRESSLQHMAQATVLAPNDMYVYYNSSLALATLGELERAAVALDKSVKLGYSIDLAKLDAGFKSVFEAGYTELIGVPEK